MSQAMRELFQTTAVAVLAFAALTLLALFLKAEAASWNTPGAAPKP
jgi:hypothetical protein